MYVWNVFDHKCTHKIKIVNMGIIWLTNYNCDANDSLCNSIIK